MGKASEISRNSAAFIVFSAMRDMHQRNRTVHTAYGADLGVAESSVLQEVIANPPGLSALELGRRLGLSAVKMSRLIKSMLAERLIVRDLVEGKLCISATDRGSKVFFEAYARAQATFNSAFERLPATRRDPFRSIMKKFCDGLAAPSASSLPEDPPVMTEIRRLTRAFGWIGRDTFRSGRPALEWHVLYLIQALRSRASCAVLANRLGTSHATMTTVLNRLAQAGLLARQAGALDARERMLLLTPAGERELARIDDLGKQSVLKALSKFSASEATSFAEDWRRYSGERLDATSVALSSPFVLERLDDISLGDARAFILKARVEQGLLENVPGYCLFEGHTSFSLRRGSLIVGVFEFGPLLKNNSVHLVQAIAASSSVDVPEGVWREALQRAREALRAEGEHESLPDIVIDIRNISEPLRLLWSRKVAS